LLQTAKEGKERMSSNWIEDRMQQALQQRKTKGTLRRLAGPLDSSIDFSSNDYLGLAQDAQQKALVEQRNDTAASLGATGSRLLSGDLQQHHLLEQWLAAIHQQPAALLCNSGYDANLSVVSSLPCDCILYDEYIHNSLHMGLRLWQQQDRKKRAASFQHNAVEDLHRQLRKLSSKRIIILVESVYSMDGDVAPLTDFLEIAQNFGANVVVDEAHGLGVYGRSDSRKGPPGTGVLAQYELEQHPALLCGVYTFGKAAGCHGAVIACRRLYKEYLVNYAYPLIYSTALPPHALTMIQCSYETIISPLGDEKRTHVFAMVQLFRQALQLILLDSTVSLLDSDSPIQALMISGSDCCTLFCQRLYDTYRIRLYPIKSPTVPSGQERIRIILHAHNTADQVETLVHAIQWTLADMGLLERAPVSRL